MIAGFSLVWVANVYMNLYSHIRLDIKRERAEIAVQEKAAEKADSDSATT